MKIHASTYSRHLGGLIAIASATLLAGCGGGGGGGAASGGGSNLTVTGSNAETAVDGALHVRRGFGIEPDS